MTRLEPMVVGAVLPLFAAVVASVPLHGRDLRLDVVLGVVCGLCLGKPLGIVAALWALRKLRLAQLPAGSTTRELFGVSLLAGIGFTVSLFIARVAFESPALENSATVGVLLGSLLAAGLGAGYFGRIGSSSERKPELPRTSGGDPTGSRSGLTSSVRRAVKHGFQATGRCATPSFDPSSRNRPRTAEAGPRR